MISNLDSSVIDANSEALGVDISILMSNAGTAISSLLKNRFHGRRFAFICGNGNNGGDGIVAAGMMIDEDVAVYLLKPADTIRSEFVKERLSELKCPVRKYCDFDPDNYDVIVDCALGTGVSGEIRPPYDEYIRTLDAYEGIVVSVDVPSGLGTDLSLKPDITITFHDVKEGMTENNSGEIIVSDIGIPDEACDKIGPGDMLRYPIPKRSSHKGSNGRLLVIGGGPYYGAPAMSAMAALRTGVDIVRLAVPETCAVSSFSPIFVITELSGDIVTCDHLEQLLELSEQFDAVLVGPGIGIDNKTIRFVRKFVTMCKVPVVIDADGLTALGDDTVLSENAILTPHIKEYERLGGKIDGNTNANVSELSKRIDAVVLLKGEIDIVSDGKRTRYNTTGNPGMTGAGTGDVLAGIVAGLLAKGMEPFDAAALGAFISGTAGDIAFEKNSYGLIALDIISSPFN